MKYLELLTTQELASILKVHENTIYNNIKKGLPVYKLSKKEYRFNLEEVLQWLKEQ